MITTNDIAGMAYNPIEYKPFAPDLERINKLYDTLMAMDKEAVSNQTKLKTVISQAPMHSSEEGYRQELLHSIENRVNEFSTEFGLAGAADAINEYVADITNSIEYRTKMDANAKYEAFVKKVMEDPKLTKMEKDYYLEKNPYKAPTGLTDPTTGKEVMYNWDLDPERINVVYLTNMDELLKQALADVATRHWEDNHPLEEIWTGKDIPIDGHKGAQFLPELQIYESMKTIIQTNAQVREGLQRKYEIGLWHDDKYGNNEWEMKTNRQIPINDANKMVLSYPEWLESMLQTYSKLAAFYYGMSPSEQARNTANEAGIIQGMPRGRSGSGSSGGHRTSKVPLTQQQKNVGNFNVTPQSNPTPQNKQGKNPKNRFK